METIMYDAIVIGSGPGGYVAAIRLAKLGKSVAVIEKAQTGGTCTNVGCIPTKAMLTASHLYTDIQKKAARFGITVTECEYNLAGIMKHMGKVVAASRKGIQFLFKKNGIDYYEGTAVVQNRETVKIEETGKELQGRNLVLAHGSTPVVFPPFSDVEGIWTSDDVFRMDAIPEEVVIVGGGVVGVEFSTFLAALGTKVYLVELLDHILPNEDPDVAKVIRKSLTRQGVNIKEGHKVSAVVKTAEGYVCTIDSKDGSQHEVTADCVLLVVGRRPVIPDDVKQLGIQIERGVVTNDAMQTSIENIYAVGDIRAQIMLAHVAMAEGIVAAHTIAGQSKHMEYSATPSVIFSSPEIAATGLKEREADLEKVEVAKFPLMANGRARTMLERDGFVKILADKATHTVLGMTIVSPNATDMIMEGVLAVRYGLTVDQLVEAIHPHPTLTETILGALEVAEGMPIHL